MEKIKNSDLIYNLINSMNLLIHAINSIKEEEYKKYIDKDTEEFIHEIINANYDLTNEIKYINNKNKIKYKKLLKLNDLFII